MDRRTWVPSGALHTPPRYLCARGLTAHRALLRAGCLAGALGPEGGVLPGLASVVALLSRRRPWPLWGALAWVAMETVRSNRPFGAMPFGRLAFATAGTPWEKALPYVGPTGVSLLLALLASCLAWLVVSPGRDRLVAGRLLSGSVRGWVAPAWPPYC